MPSRRLSARTMLDVTLTATMTRNLLTSNPAPVIKELRALAGDDVELLAEVSGRVSGFYDEPHTHMLCAALADQIEGAAAWVPLGRKRRSAPVHGAPRREVDRPGEAGRAGEVEPEVE